MFSLRRIALAPRVCGTTTASTITPSGVSMPMMASQRNRRYSSSSSKPSNPSAPSNNSNNGNGTAATTGIAAAAAALKRSGRAGLKTVRSSAGAMGVKEGTNIPVVPSTDHLHPADVAISTFFAQHRPVSISHVVPLSYSENSFDSIFTRRKLSPIHDSHASSMAADFGAPENNANEVITPESLVGGKRYMPFCPPPVPQAQTAFVRPAKMQFNNRIVDMPLERIMIRQQIQEENTMDEMKDMVEPESEDRGVMQALSVKRRRGLRMKKHKLKKLRKRTRNLRRRIESHSK